MEHCEPEQLALAALREPLSSDDATHLASCERCRADVASLQRTVDVLAVPEFAAHAPSSTPPPRVWDAIAAATGVSASPAEISAPPADIFAPPAGISAPPAEIPASATQMSASPTAGEPGADVHVLRPRRTQRTRLLLAAAAVAVVAAGAGAIAVNRDHTVTLASTSLNPLDAAKATGKASVVEERDGTRVLRIDLDAPAPHSGYYEAWLADQSATGMVSMGSVRPGTTSLPVPDDLDLAKFPLVEVSVEPLDGNPGHSGVSLVRGQLDR